MVSSLARNDWRVNPDDKGKCGMRSWVLIFAALVAVPSAMAQTSKSHGEAYVVVAPFGQPVWNGSTTYLAGGGQVFMFKAMSIGAEVGPVFTRSEGGNEYVFGLGSANLAYHFLRNADNIQPFITAGYAATFRAGVQSGSNVGLGINVWRKKNM